MQSNTIKINDEFLEIDTRSIDERSRITLGRHLRGIKRFRIFENKRGEFLLQPLVELPVSETWLFQNKEALKSVQKGLDDARKGKISKLDLNKL